MDLDIGDAGDLQPEPLFELMGQCVCVLYGHLLIDNDMEIDSYVVFSSASANLVALFDTFDAMVGPTSPMMFEAPSKKEWNSSATILTEVMR